MELLNNIIVFILALAIVAALIVLFPVMVATIVIGSLVIIVAEIIKSVMHK